MANNRNEIVDSDTNCTEQIHRFSDSYNISNVINEGSSTSEKRKFFPKVLKNLILSIVRIVQSKKKKPHARKRSASTLCKSEEKITKCTSLSSIVDNVKSDHHVETVANQENTKKKMINAVTSTTRFVETLDKVTHERLLNVVRNLIHNASYRDAKYAVKYTGSAVQESGCGPLCIGAQSDKVAEEFSLRTTSDAFAKACEEKQYVDFILGKTAKDSDVLTEKALVAFVKKQMSSIILGSENYQMGEETFENTEPLIPSIIPAEAVASSRDFELDSQISARDKSPSSISDIQTISPMNHLREAESTPTTSIIYPERDDFQDAAVEDTSVVRRKEEEESSKEISAEPTLDKYIDETDYTAVNSVIINCIPKLKKTRSNSVYQPMNVKPVASKIITSEDNDLPSSILKNSSFKPKKENYISIKDKRRKLAKEIPSKSVSFRFKKPKYRAKYRVDTPYMIKEEKEEKVSLFKKMWLKDYDKSRFVALPSPEVIRTCRSFDHFERPAMYQYCRSKLLRYLQPYCDVWTIRCFNSQDLRATGYCACDSLVDSYVSFKYFIDYNISDCTKCRVAFENSLCADTYCKKDAKYYCPHLNNIDNVRMGYYHCSCSVRNNNQHCGTDRSYYCTKGNLYFTHPWTSEHLL